MVPDTWNGPWHSRHQLLTRLGKHFEVLWVEEAAGWREILTDREARRKATGIAPSVREGFSIYSPDKWLPRVYFPYKLGMLLTRIRLMRARRFLKARGCDSIVLDLWRPEQAFTLNAVRHDLSCYHIDDEYTFSEIERPQDPGESALIAKVDQVFISSHALVEKKGRYNPRYRIVPNGVNYASFASPTPEPDDLKGIPHPRIGYVGVVKKQMDLDLILKVARAHPEWSFVFTGPKGYLGESAGLVDALEKLPNVHLLGGRPVDKLPAYTQHVDVCLLCYKINDYTKFIYPLKLHEYLAGGRPVVGPPIPALKEFTHVVRIATTPEEWGDAIAQSLDPTEGSPERVESRRKVAREYDWASLADQTAAAIREGLARKSSP